MKTPTKHILTALTIAAASFCVPAARANLNFHIDANTSPLIGSPQGPFAIDFQLNSGTTLSNNTVTLSNFTFGLGTFSGAPTLLGGASGSLASSVTLSDNSPLFNEFTQGFIPGNKLGFDVSMTTNTDTGLTQDMFAFTILDNTGGQVFTNSPNTLDLAEVSVGNQPVGFQTTAPSPLGVTTVVPEPRNIIIGIAVSAFCAWQIARRRFARA